MLKLCKVSRADLWYNGLPRLGAHSLNVFNIEVEICFFFLGLQAQLY